MILRRLVKIANTLDQKGLYAEADLIDCVLKKAIVNPMTIPDDQLNIENQGYGGGESRIGGGYAGLSIDEAMRADDESKNIKVLVGHDLDKGELSYENGMFTLKHYLPRYGADITKRPTLEKLIKDVGYRIFVSDDREIGSLTGNPMYFKIKEYPGNWYPIDFFQEWYIMGMLGVEQEHTEEDMSAEDTEYEKEWFNILGLYFRVHDALRLAEKYTPIQKPVKDSQYGLMTVNKEHAMKTDLSKPLIFVTLLIEDDKGKFKYELCIDGHHRAYKADKMGIPTLPSIVLSPEDTLKVMADGPTKDKMIKAMENSDEDEQDNVDMVARNNGLQGNSPIDNQNSGSFQGFSDAYFYRGYGNLEGIYGPQNR